MNNNTPTTMSLYTDALAARFAALVGTKITFVIWKDLEGDGRAWISHMEAIDAYDTACAEVEAIEEAMERAL